MNEYRGRLSVLAIAPAVLALAATARAAVEFDGRSRREGRNILSVVTASPAPEAVPVRAVPQPTGPPEDWRTEVLYGAVIDINRKFQALEAGGYEIRVEKCQFGRFSPDTILIRKRKLPEGVRPGTRTEYLLNGEFQRRMSRLEGLGIEIEVKCFERLPWHFGDHGVIQYRNKAR